MNLTIEEFISIAGCYGDIHKEDDGYSCYVPVCKTFGWKLNYYNLSNRLSISAVVNDGSKAESESIFTDFGTNKERLLKSLSVLNGIHHDLAVIF
jgi:hypothetical protein